MASVLITMKTTQSVAEDDAEKTELITLGTCSYRKGVLTLSYQDSAATGFEGSKTTIRVTGNEKASIVRTGSACSNMILEPDKKHYCLYQTPFGFVTMGVQTKLVFCKHDGKSGMIQLAYTIDMNSVFVSDNRITIYWEQQDKSKGTK